MLTKHQAEQLAEKHLDQLLSATSLVEPCRLYPELTKEYDFGWVFFWNLCDWPDSTSTVALGGNAPFLVERESGRILTLGTAYSLNHYILSYELFGDPSALGNAESRGFLVRITGAPTSVSLRDFVRLMRKHTALSIQQARTLLQRAQAGEGPGVRTPNIAAAESLSALLQQLGCTTALDVSAWPPSDLQ